ncbi:MAG: zinc ABC transporter solute-binding protein [candidate division Zixibacteria bacterium]|nr:zinc ABC transporter solute-binding protein [candidate division Zixibacteria bacterium]NIR68145.1 zinc ABC transporter solute-binding protein [candidate division Zixibacteria bacterium]NIS17821.1 zinc ABC transporter solute-binding protein [candidate division Zixibacteria bacterium]NIS49360.1 zinc ABC transporter solute-binding protein [candidate division Zixibacteria bacterium]NIT54139.1 zinc ABC transporter solute-binding protein [candidate division Zixibacteria bacterium]
MKRIPILILIPILLLLPCKSGASQKTNVFVGIPPLEYLVERIAGDLVECHILLKPGESPHTFEPAPRQMIDLSQSSFYFALGFPFESRIIEKLSEAENPRIIDITAGTDRRYMHSHIDLDEEHPHKDNHDPHIWLSPDNIRIISQNIEKTLAEHDPSNGTIYSDRLKALLQDLDSIDQIIDSLLSPFKGASVMVFHPAFGYITDYYGLNQIAVETEGKSPGPKQIESIINEARESDTRVIFVQPRFDPKSAQSIASAIGGEVVPIDPLERNILENLLDIAEKIRGALK